MQSNYDVFIAGAGPAGSAAAIVLRQAGFSVCLSDPVDSEQRKIGESLPGATRRLLARLGIASITTLLSPEHYRVCTGNVSAWGCEQWQYQDAVLNPEGGGFHINRAAFDKALRQNAIAAGAVFLSEKISLVGREKLSASKQRFVINPPHLKQQVTSYWFIDATGRAARIARQFGHLRQQLHQQAAQVCWIRAPADDRDQASRIKLDKQGWWYSALIPDYCRVIVFQGRAEQLRSLHCEPQLFVDRFNKTNICKYPVQIEQVLEWRTAGSGLQRTRLPASGGLFCVGDAALAPDPLSVQGIFFALYSGIRAAESICRVVTGQPEAAAYSQYCQMIERVFQEQEKSLHYLYNMAGITVN